MLEALFVAFSQECRMLEVSNNKDYNIELDIDNMGPFSD